MGVGVGGGGVGVGVGVGMAGTLQYPTSNAFIVGTGDDQCVLPLMGNTR